MWWERVAKKQIHLLLTREGTKRRKENNGNFFYHDLLQNPSHQAEKMAAVNRLKTKLVKLYCARLARVELQTLERVQEERISLYRLMKRRTRREQIITEIQDPNNGTQTSMKEMLDASSACIRQKYGPILVEEECVRQMEMAGHRRLSEEWKEALDMSLTLERLKLAVKKDGGNKAPGRDGIGLEFSKVT